MRPRLGSVLLLAALAAPLPARAVIGAVDVTPAATLLVPYFEVDLDAASGTDARITVVNASAGALLTRVVLWTDAAVPVFGFNLYLTGYDVQPLSLRAILGGELPATATAGQDPTDTISPQGPSSQDLNYPTCGGLMPPAPLDASALAALRAALTGQDVGGGQCAGLPHGDQVARGFVTVDTVGGCSDLLPNQAGYFAASGTGLATDQNRLLGDFALFDAAGAVIAAAPAVHIEASPTDPLTSTPGSYTFYGRCVGWSADDNREPLATQWAAPYEGSGARLIIWRDPKAAPATFDCADEQPAWYPLASEGVAGFDRQETVTTLDAPSVSHVPGEQGPPPPLPGALNVVEVGAGAFAAMAPRGWMSLDLNASVPAAGSFPVADPAAAQAHVLVLDRPKAVPGSAPLATSHGAVPLDSASAASHGWPWNPPWPAPPAALGTAGPRPAASLLLPYFEVSLDDPNLASTSLTLTNVTATALMAHVVLWTDLGVPTYWGNVYLTGYDVATVDLRLLFAAGLTEVTASAGQDYSDKISPKGSMSQDINFATCNGLLPEPRLSEAQREHLRAAHTGQPSALWGGLCAGAPLGDRIARGYVTVDLVNSCTATIPGQPGYFGSGGTGVATNQNNLTGTFTFINRAAAVAYGGPLTHLQASSTGAVATPDSATFYGRYLGWSAADNREPLGNSWQTRFASDGAGGRTSLLVWQDPGAPVAAFACGSLPAAFPLDNVTIDAFDEQENVVTLGSALLPRVAARVDVGPGGLDVPYSAGFLALNFLGAEPRARQASVVAIHPHGGRAAALGAFQIDNPSW